VKDVTAVLDHFNIDKGILVGHSNGAFVALLAALRIPSRLLGVMLLDGGFPRDPKNEKLDEATAAGVARAKTKLAQAFSSLDAYIEFQNPAKGLTAATIHPDILAMYKYELQQCEDGLRVKVCPRCVEMDMTALVTRFLTAEQMAAVTVPVGMVVAEHGFADNLPPMMRKDHVDDMRKALQPKVLDYVQGANHYTLLMDDRFVPQTAASIEKFVNIVLPDYA
jgi:pimeloyl-ACP methyl ester carboxylesterase